MSDGACVRCGFYPRYCIDGEEWPHRCNDGKARYADGSEEVRITRGKARDLQVMDRKPDRGENP